MKNKMLISLAAVLILWAGLFTPAAFAADHALVDGGSLDISTCTSGDTVTVASGASVTLSGSNTNIKIVCGAGAAVTLAGITVNNDSFDDACPLVFAGLGNTLTLAPGTINTLAAGAHTPGIRVETGTTLTIGGSGTLNATGKRCGAGIGGGVNYSSGTIIITGGTINALGAADSAASSGAGIGGGAGKSNGTVTITGGIVNAVSARWGAGIGGGYMGGGGTVTITGGTVTANSTGSKGNDIGTGGDMSTWFQIGTLTLDGAASLTLGSLGTNAAVTKGDCCILDNSTLSPIPDGCYMDGVLFTGTVIDVTDGSITGNGAGYSSPTVTITDPAIDYLIKGSTTINHVVVSSGSATDITLFGASIMHSSDNLIAFDITGSNVNLRLIGSNWLTSDKNGGINCPYAATLRIDGKGSLTAQGGDNGAGIGSEYGSGGITIAGGTVLAIGGDQGAGIGGGYLGNGSVLITGGTVTAKGGNSSAGIGSGPYATSGSSISISGGTVYCTRGLLGPYDIGDGKESDGADTTLSISGTAQVFFANDKCIPSSTSTHTHLTITQAASEVYGVPVPSAWSPTFGAYLRICTLVYDTNGGSGTAPASVTKLYQSTATVSSSSSIERTGYDSTGWNTAANGSGTSYFGGDAFAFTADTTLFAGWSPHTYTVNYLANTGTGTTASSIHTYDESKPLTANGFTHTGFTFAGWAASPGGAVVYADGQSVTNLTATDGVTVTLFAKWTANAYTVTYDANGGTGTTAPSSHRYDEPKALTISSFTRDNYQFEGWAASADGTVAYTDGQSVLNLCETNGKTVTLYAKWVLTPRITAVSGNAAYGTVSGGGDYTQGAQVTLKAMAKSGYAFAGWYAGQALVSSSAAYTFTATQNLTLTAQFDKVGIPEKITASATAFNRIIFSWSAVPGATGYRVYRAASESGIYKLVKTSSATRYINTFLKTGTTYYYKVLAYTGYRSNWLSGKYYSAVASATPSLAAVTGTKAKALSSSSIKLSWALVDGATGYEVWRCASEAGTYKKVNTSLFNTTTDRNLTKGATYYYKIRAYRLVGGAKVYGAYSAVMSIKP